MNRILTTATGLILAALVALLGFGCDSPCDDAWGKLRRCTKHTAEKKVFRSAEAQKVFNLGCKRVDKERVRKCLGIKDCPKFRKCMGQVASTRPKTRQ